MLPAYDASIRKRDHGKNNWSAYGQHLITSLIKKILYKIDQTLQKVIKPCDN